MVTPKLTLDFTSGALSSLVTFSRAGAAATQVNSSGYIENVAADTPRLDYDPLTLACKGLLVEEAKTNDITYSEKLDFYWTKFNCTVADNTDVSPRNTQTASVLSSTSAGTFLYSSPSFTNEQQYVLSIFAKAKNGNELTIVGNSASLGFAIATFNLTTGNVVSASGTGSFAAIQPFRNGWYRCILGMTASATGSYQLRIFTQDLVDTLALFGSQLEAGAFVTSYIPTEATAVTRNEDVAIITGANFSDFWQASKGGAQVQSIPSTVSGIRPLVQYDDGTANNIIALRGNATNPELQIVTGGSPQVQLDAGTIVSNSPYNLTSWWATNDCKARQNGGSVVTDITATIPTVTQARLGSDGTNYLNGHLATVNYYNVFSCQIYTRRKNKAIFSLL